jgi:hypothetical protein
MKRTSSQVGNLPGNRGYGVEGIGLVEGLEGGYSALRIGLGYRRGMGRNWQLRSCRSRDRLCRRHDFC